MSDGRRRASPREAIGLVTRREFTQRVRSKVFGITTALMVVAVVATAIILNAVSGHTSSVKVGVLPQTAAARRALTRHRGRAGAADHHGAGA